MKFIYPAVFRPTESGGYRAWFPDLVELEEDEPILPYVSDHDDIETAEGDIIRNISVNIRFYEGWDE